LSSMKQREEYPRKSSMNSRRREREREREREKRGTKRVKERDISERSADPPVPSFRAKRSSTNASPIFSRRFFAPVISTLICPIILLPPGKRAEVKAINLSQERTHPRVFAREYIPKNVIRTGKGSALYGYAESPLLSRIFLSDELRLRSSGSCRR